jgi:hypothetical protein
LLGQRLRLAAAPTDPGSCGLPAPIDGRLHLTLPMHRPIKVEVVLLGGVQLVAGLGVLSAGGALSAVAAGA